ncbi:MAG: type I pullulanase [Lachnospiraceae bacterium]|nr:type I pullulanase [Lachnospiraceae bacterium]
MTGLDFKNYYETEAFKKECIDLNTQWGSHYAKEGTRFFVWSTKADGVNVCIYTRGTDGEEGARQVGVYPMTVGTEMGKKATYECYVEGDLEGYYYTYQVIREGQMFECPDPYGRSAGANGQRSMILDLGATNPAGWDKDANWKQINPYTAIYELHVKDFSYQEASGVSSAHRGKFLAFTEKCKATKHLMDLGISHVHFLPMYDYGSVDETGTDDQFNWGYDPVNYNVPEGSYSTNPYDGRVRVKEAKQMIQALHNMGIGVVMDVVYNHTYRSDDGFQILAPYYYYRTKEDGTLADASACGDETATEKEMFNQFIRQSLLYWAQEYHMDGFRFDLMAIHDVATMNQIRADLNSLPTGKKILLYGEPWAAATPAMAEGVYPADKAHLDMLDEGIAIFSDDTRDAIKGSVFYAKEPGYVNGKAGMEDKIAHTFSAWCHSQDVPKHVPGQIISYVSVHDNYTLWDKLVLTMTGGEEFGKRHPQVIDANKLTAAIVYLSLGTPLMQAGEEFGRTKLGDENSYASSPVLNQLDYNRMEEYSDLVSYYQGLIQFRRKLGIYLDGSSAAAEQVKTLYAQDGIVVMEVDNTPYADKGDWKKVLLMCNSNRQDKEYTLPEGTWKKLLDKNSSWLWKNDSLWSTITGKGIETCKGAVTLSASSMTVLGRKEV